MHAVNRPDPLRQQVVARISSLPPGDHQIAVTHAGVDMHFRLRIVPGATCLAFSFHGAADRERRQPPIFNGFFPEMEGIHQIAISDPSLPVANSFRVSWFAGHSGFATQKHLAAALKSIIDVLQPERTIYFGSSGGGFAALYFAALVPGSFVVVSNPQTNILRYSPSLVAAYREACWPDLSDNAQLSEAVCTDVAELYRKAFRNTIIYVQSMGDRHHATSHLLPFTAAIASHPRVRRFLLQSEFNGKHGHVTDHAGCADWIRAIRLSPSDDPKDLLQSWHDLRTQREARIAAQHIGSPAAPARPWPEAADLAVAERLRAFRKART